MAMVMSLIEVCYIVFIEIVEFGEMIVSLISKDEDTYVLPTSRGTYLPGIVPTTNNSRHTQQQTAEMAKRRTRRPRRQ